MQFKPGQIVYHVSDWLGKPILYSTCVKKVTAKQIQVVERIPGIGNSTLTGAILLQIHATPRAAWREYVNRVGAQISILESQIRTLTEKQTLAKQHA